MRVTFIGAGVMGRAIAEGAAAKEAQRWQFTFFDPNLKSAQEAAQATSGTAATTVEDAVQDAEVVVLAVKPQVQARVIEALPKLADCVLVSIAAGRSLADILASLSKAGQPSVPVIRVMPNLNAIVGSATSAICPDDLVSPEQLEAVTALFDAVGTTLQLDEHLISAFTAMAGSSPAWFFQIVDDLARAGVKHGLTKAAATSAACSTMLGSALMLQKTLAEGGNAAELVDRVCSPGGTTITGLLAAQEAGLGPSLVAAVDATIARDRELGA
ncbi:pyrroline-5-carboxylate reductase [Actinomyces minihominis]|uniref:pyrroline-5-carboxylate reductase n=1 Tax=Actinomyces minihominis TaxID=2002838 RepID=UPI000C08D5ED|nr:pyrroline-5-carboxylate reductase [Actinomyces minihominis]